MYGPHEVTVTKSKKSSSQAVNYAVHFTVYSTIRTRLGSHIASRPIPCASGLLPMLPYISHVYPALHIRCIIAMCLRVQKNASRAFPCVSRVPICVSRLPNRSVHPIVEAKLLSANAGSSSSESSHTSPTLAFVAAACGCASDTPLSVRLPVRQITSGVTEAHH